jgi:glutamate racemase
MKIGVFDSGVGGITVLKELQKRFPAADFIYLGDTAHVPYGTKSPAQIKRLSLRCARILKSKTIDLLVVACNTASSWALPVLETLLKPIPVVGMVKPGIEAALAAFSRPSLKDSPHSAILVLATRATVMSRAYAEDLHALLSPIPVLQQACPLLVAMIEEGWIDHPILRLTIREYVQPYVDQYPSGVAVLGCTHYPWIHREIEKAMPGWVVVDSSWAVGEMLARESFMRDVTASAKISDVPGSTEWIFTDEDAVPTFAKRWIDGRGDQAS